MCGTRASIYINWEGGVEPPQQIETFRSREVISNTLQKLVHVHGLALQSFHTFQESLVLSRTETTLYLLTNRKRSEHEARAQHLTSRADAQIQYLLQEVCSSFSLFVLGCCFLWNRRHYLFCLASNLTFVFTTNVQFRPNARAGIKIFQIWCHITRTGFWWSTWGIKSPRIIRWEINCVHLEIRN